MKRNNEDKKILLEFQKILGVGKNIAQDLGDLGSGSFDNLRKPSVKN